MWVIDGDVAPPPTSARSERQAMSGTKHTLRDSPGTRETHTPRHSLANQHDGGIRSNPPVRRSQR